MDAVERMGWNLSLAGLTVCQDLCKEKGLAPNGKNLSHVALDLDLKTIAAPTLSTGLTHGGPHKIDRSATVLQIQRVKNVAVPSGKQHNPSPSKRLLRLQLSDGHMSISATEIEGPIERLSPVTPPGTKIKITGGASVVNGFILLKKSSTEVLGGNVELLLQKWNMHKDMPDNISRDKGGEEDGPPQYVKFSKLQAAYVKQPKSSEDHSGKKPQKQAMAAEEEAVSTREQMELPASYRMGTGSKKEREVKSFPRGPPPLPPAGLPLTADIEDLRPSTSGMGRGRGRGRGVGVTSDGRRDGSDSRGREGRGRGRRQDRDDDEDDYCPQRRKEAYQLADFIKAPAATKKEEDVMKDYQYNAVSDRYYANPKKPLQTDNVLEDYEYDPVTDQYYPKASRGRGGSRYGDHIHVHHFGEDYSHHETSCDNKKEGNRGRETYRGKGRGRGGRQRSDFDGGRGGRRERSDFDGGRERDFDGGKGREKDYFDRGREGGNFDGGRERGSFDRGRERGNFDGGREKEGERRFDGGKEGRRGGYKGGFEARGTSVDERGYHQGGKDIAPNDPWAHLNTSASVPSSAKKM